jgi:hypothetical protein
MLVLMEEKTYNIFLINSFAVLTLQPELGCSINNCMLALYTVEIIVDAAQCVDHVRKPSLNYC